MASTKHNNQTEGRGGDGGGINKVCYFLLFLFFWHLFLLILFFSLKLLSLAAGEGDVEAVGVTVLWVMM